jgi:hypothetical protein
VHGVQGRGVTRSVIVSALYRCHSNPEYSDCSNLRSHTAKRACKNRVHIPACLSCLKACEYVVLARTRAGVQHAVNQCAA